MKERPRRDSKALSAYHDGELRGLARWRFERRLRRDPALRRELELLRRVGDAVREVGAQEPGADLWDRIALRLPAADAARSEAAGRGRRPAWLVGLPIGAAVAAALAAVAIFWRAGQLPEEGVVRWIYAGKHNVYVLDAPEAPGATIIWMLDTGPKQAAERRSPVGSA